MDPNADPTPAELAEWRAADLAMAQEWARGRLARAKQLGDVEVLQHLGNLTKGLDAARVRLGEFEAAARAIDTAHQPYRKRGGRIQRCVTCSTGWPCRTRAALDAVPAAETGSGDEPCVCDTQFTCMADEHKGGMPL